MLDDAFDRALLTLRRAAGTAPLSIFIDPTLRDPTEHDPRFAAEMQLAIASGTSSRHLLPLIHEDFDPARRPFLLHFGAEPVAERTVAAAVRIATNEAFDVESPEFTGRTVCGFIVHDTHPALRVQALAQAARLRKPDGRPHFLRLWDPRVCVHLTRCLPVDHWTSISAAMGRWMHFDIQRQLTMLPPNAASDLAPASAGTAATQATEVQTWQRLERIGPVNKLLALSWGWGLLPTASLVQQIDALVARSGERGFDGEQDVLVFVACGLTCHPQFDHHPQVQHALKEATLSGMPLQSALERFDEDFWARLRDDTQWLNSPRFPAERGNIKYANS